MSKTVETVFPDFIAFKLSCIQDGENTITYTESNDTYIPQALTSLLESNKVFKAPEDTAEDLLK
jgi:hypothetical protein